MASNTERNRWYSIPAPVRTLFNKFPLVTYPENDLPLPRRNRENVLYVFGESPLSYNPSCLKWQAYLRFSGINYSAIASSNHASPSGALPFLLPSTADTKPSKPVPSSRLQRWAMNNSAAAIEESSDTRYEAYLSLLEHKIRRAWLYSVYLSANSTSIAEPLYVLPTSRNSFVRLTIARDLRCAAENELLKFSAIIDADLLHSEAEEAFNSLESLLGEDTWFFDNQMPGLFDASVFAYTHLLLDDNLGSGWADTRLRDTIVQKKRLVAHRNRILDQFFASA
ncbi:hypothetical protein BU24DRAFT_413193 [Aaosphaeria arxii CBS 175.79]|uniref:Mitochondrial outer membrane protein n=1 Tax=Aaosphaeria arxii CBS 175.79 TaxID=1450172 RepID=A0A6A5XEP1_9PLEO|nr:uncharacterized protein BU24DRAFT_413193 [Aaosphaeria arxii CBS 175.79]KAF2011558.1 hypothetical protein BU24DRAFT_413193 [Aaosphaeria arxii CBS 175.79]